VIRLLVIAGAAGIVIGVMLLVLRGPLSRVVFPSASHRVGDLLPLFALATPFGLLGQIALVTASAFEHGRRWIPVAFLLGTVINVTWIAIGMHSSGASAAAAAAAAAAIVTNAVLIALAVGRVLSAALRAAPTRREPQALA
jgi:hypothetical protein